MSAEAELSGLLRELEHRAAGSPREADAAELVEVAVVAAEMRDGACRITDRVANGATSWAAVWADPLSEGQAGLDLLAATMHRAAWDGGGRPLE